VNNSAVEEAVRFVLIGVILVLVVVHFFSAGTNLDSTTIGLLAVVLLLLVLDQVEEFKLPGGTGAKLRKKVEELGNLRIPHLPSEGFEGQDDVGGRAMDLVTSTGDPLAGVVVLRGQIRDRLSYINTNLLGESCCQDPFGVLDRLRDEERLPLERVDSMLEVLLATEQIAAQGGAKEEAVRGLIKSASGIHRGIAPVVFESLVRESLHELDVKLLERPIPETGHPIAPGANEVAKASVRTEFLIQQGDSLIQARLAELPSSPLLRKVVDRLKTRRRTEQLDANRVLIVVPNASRSLKDEVPSWLEILTLDDLRLGRWR
jgi:hypothetical protein